MSVVIHPVHKYKISPTTGKRLPSVNQLNRAIAKKEKELTLLKTLLQEHLMEVAK